MRIIVLVSVVLSMACADVDPDLGQVGLSDTAVFERSRAPHPPKSGDSCTLVGCAGGLTAGRLEDCGPAGNCTCHAGGSSGNCGGFNDVCFEDPGNCDDDSGLRYLSW